MTGNSDGQLIGLTILLQISKRVRDALGPEEIGFIAVNESKQLLHYRQSALWLAEKGIFAVSGIPEPDPSSPYIQWLTTVFRELQKGKGCRRIAPRDLPSLLSSAWTDWLPRHGVVVPLITKSGKSLGLLFFVREEPWEDHDLALLIELSSIYAYGLKAVKQQKAIHRRMRSFAAKSSARIVILLLVVGSLFYPVRMSVQAPAEVVPKDPFVIRSPFDGVIDRFHVSPNQSVSNGQMLFSFDKTNLRARTGLALKSFEVASEEHRQATQQAISDDKSRAEVTPLRGKMEGKETELSYSREIFQRLDVRTPRTGIAVFSEQSDWVGRNVSIGERVLVIADPKNVEILIQLPVADAIELSIGTPVILYLAMDTLHPLEGTLRYASYNPEVVPAGFVAYRLKADFDTHTKLPRIGLTGTVKVYGKKVTLGYYIFRRPLAAIQQRFGW